MCKIEDKILVSICCITYNHQHYISDAIESFLMQKTDFEFEILIGEDCSKDQTRKIVEKYVNQYTGKVKLITSEENVGARKNVLRLQEKAKGKYIAVCEGDDYWIDPYKLKKQVTYMEKNPKCSMSFHAAEIVQADKVKSGKIVKPFNEDTICSADEFILGGGSFFPTASLIYHKSIMDNPPEFYLRASVGDYPLAIILSSKGYAYYIDEIMSAYRTDAKGSWGSQNLSGKDIRSKYIKNFENDIYILEGFNEFSNYKYKDVVKKAISERRVYIMLFLKNIFGIKNSEYGSYFRDLRLSRKIKMILLSYNPKAYTNVANFIHSIKR